MEKYNFLNPKNIIENSDKKIISYKNKISNLLKYLNEFDEKNKDESELDMVMGISILAGAFLGDAYGSFFCDKPNNNVNQKLENLDWTFFNPYFKTSKGQITDSAELSLSLAFGLIDSAEEFDKNLDNLGLSSYGISVTTLEEVFLRVGHGIEDEDNEVKNELKLVEE